MWQIVAFAILALALELALGVAVGTLLMHADRHAPDHVSGADPHEELH